MMATAVAIHSAIAARSGSSRRTSSSGIPPSPRLVDQIQVAEDPVQDEGRGVDQLFGPELADGLSGDE